MTEKTGTETVKLPRPDERVFITNTFCGLYTKQVCVVPDATDAEILAACNDDESKHGGTHRWTKVIRTMDDLKALNLEQDESVLPGTCVECPPRLHMVVR